MPTFAVFDQVNDLILGWHLWKGTEALLANVIQLHASGPWAVQIDSGTNKVETIKQLFIQHTMKVAVQASWPDFKPQRPDAKRGKQHQVLLLTAPLTQALKAAEVSLRSIVTAAWRYEDPIMARQSNLQDGYRQECGYILAARSEEEAGNLLQTLTRALTPGIRVAPLMTSNGVPDRWPYLWILTTENAAPPLSALTAAARAWWMPMTAIRGEQVFMEWPFHWDLREPELSEPVIASIDWGAQLDDIVLLSRPRDGDDGIVVVRQPESGLGSVLDVSSLKAADTALTERSVTSGQPRVTFEVDLRIIPGRWRSTGKERYNEINRSIQALEAERERLKRHEGVIEAIVNSLPEPLFIYSQAGFSQLNDPTGLPRQLRRLLTEMSDQPQELAAVRYQAVRSETLPSDMRLPGSLCHIITTAACLPGDEPCHEAVSMRLRSFEPMEGVPSVYERSPEWASCGLNLFVPRGSRLALYPEVPVSNDNAEKLARALLPAHLAPADRDMSRWLILVRLVDGRVASCCIRTDGFRKIVDSFDWRCAVVVDPPVSRDDQLCRNSTAVDQAIVASINKSFIGVAEKQEQLRLDTYTARLEQRLNDRTMSLQNHYKARNDQVTKEHNEKMTELNKKATAWKVLCDKLQARIDALKAAAKEAVSGVDLASTAAQDLARQLGSVTTDTAAVRRAVTQMDENSKKIEAAKKEAECLQAPLREDFLKIERDHRDRK